MKTIPKEKPEHFEITKYPGFFFVKSSFRQVSRPNAQKFLENTEMCVRVP